VPFSHRLATLVEPPIHGLYQALVAEKGEVDNDFPNYFGSGIFGMV
jgi:antibiotic biosynthesis monooxygenase (ABM) superfamily enzyme